MENLSYVIWGFTFPLAVAILTAQNLPNDSTSHYAGSGVCALCHSGLTDSSGEDVSISGDWKSTMMANASRDPLWQMKVYSETIRNPKLSAVIQDKCATCHMPMARSEQAFRNEEVFMWENGLLSKGHDLHKLAMDGVSCTLCHQIAADSLGAEESYSGHYRIDRETERPARRIYGPYKNPSVNPMRNSASFTPKYSDHIEESGLCATCHTLYTPVINEQGDHVGDFPEQTPYIEWEHSVFSREGNQFRSCQDCHMPIASGGVVISNRPRRLGARSPFYKHIFVGGNTLMLQVLSEYSNELDLSTSSERLQITKERTERQLKSKTATIEIERTSVDGSTLTIGLRVQNKTGHKFPTGFPSRRAWIHLAVTDSRGAVIFESGKPGAHGSMTGNDADSDPNTYEKHYSIIRNTDEVQIYEVIMKDLNNEVTYTLLDASDRIKDNRLLPKGFVKGEANANIAVVGQAGVDPDFQGESDLISYQVPLGETKPPYNVKAELLYQTVSYRFWKDLLREDEVRQVLQNDSIKALGDRNTAFTVSSAQTTVGK